jgi:Domain of unknown function (DUF4279)
MTGGDMPTQKPVRSARFRVVSHTHTVDELSGLIDLAPDFTLAAGSVRPDSVLRRPAAENSWELVEAGDSSSDVGDMLERLIDRIAARAENLRVLHSEGCILLISIIQELSPDDDAGPGFSIGFRVLEFLARVGAEIDVDQYVLTDE